jgi:hypothetical protein
VVASPKNDSPQGLSPQWLQALLFSDIHYSQELRQRIGRKFFKNNQTFAGQRRRERDRLTDNMGNSF